MSKDSGLEQALVFSEAFKDTSYVWGKKQQKLQLLDILACNSANKQSFQNPTKSLFAQRSIDGKSAALFTSMDRWANKSESGL